MLRLNSSYSKKVPADAEYSSQSYHCSVEAELPDGLTSEQIKERIHATFELCRTAVEAELQGGGAVASAPTAAPPIAPPLPQGRTANTASPKQIGFVKTLAARQRITPTDLVTLVAERYGVANVEELTKRQASELIDSMNQRAA